MPLVAADVVDQVVVVDDSTDGTAAIARSAGAEVYRQSDLAPELGPVRGKGDALWRALTVLEGDVVCFLDADSEQLGPHFACGLVGPLACDSGIDFVKGFYRRPFRSGGRTQEHGGGRVTELTAKPLLRRFFPELAGFHQPLAGEVAVRRDLLSALPFVTGYGVDIALLIDVWRAGGLDRMAQVDLDERQNRHQPLADLGPMASAVLDAVVSRLVPQAGPPGVHERRPLIPAGSDSVGVRWQTPTSSSPALPASSADTSSTPRVGMQGSGRSSVTLQS